MNGPTSTLLAALNLSEEDKARVLAKIRDRARQPPATGCHRRPERPKETEATAAIDNEEVLDQKQVDRQWTEFARWRKKRRRRRKLRQQILRDVLRELGIVLTKKTRQKKIQTPWNHEHAAQKINQYTLLHTYSLSLHG